MNVRELLDYDPAKIIMQASMREMEKQAMIVYASFTNPPINF